MSDYAPRWIDTALAAASTTFPAVLLVGPRACGKTTSARRIAATTVRLDEPADANRYRLAPDESLRDEQALVLLDEWQLVPDVLGAVKRAVDDNPAPGRFVITSSVQAERSLPTWPLTGRAARLRMFGLTEREISRAPDAHGVIDVLRSAGLDGLTAPRQSPTVSQYVATALAGTLPYPRLHLDPGQHHSWYAGYVDQVVFRDLAELEPSRDPIRLRRFLQSYALNTGGVAPLRTLYEAAHVDQRTATAYERLLSQLFLIEHLPAFASNRLKRLVRMPKRCLVEPALLGPLTGVSAAGILSDPDLLGRLLETFVISQLRPEVAISGDATLYHLREEGGRREVDVVVELDDGRVIGIEVKATSTPSAKAARHLIDLRDALGDRFIAGLVLHTGRGLTRLDERIAAAPIAMLWA